MFLLCLAVAKEPLYEKASSVVVCGWTRPRFLVVLLDWLGDLRVVLFWWFVLLDGDLICLRLGTGQLCQVSPFFTAYVSIRTVPQSIYGQTRGKKRHQNASTELESVLADRIGMAACSMCFLERKPEHETVNVW